MLPKCARDYIRNNSNSTEKFHAYFEGFHDGAKFVVDSLEPHIKGLTKNHKDLNV